MVSKADRRASREAAAAALWAASHDKEAWTAALAAYPSRRPDPHTHAAYYARAEASPSLSTLTKNDIIAAVTFKNARGTPRPLLHHARALDEADVEKAARSAERALGEDAEPSTAQLSAACAALETLKGVGPATASLLISDCNDSVPFLSDEASAVVLGRRDYKRADVLELTTALRERAGELGWTARDVERALFSASRAEEGGGDKGKKAAKPAASAATGKKRKAAAK